MVDIDDRVSGLLEEITEKNQCISELEDKIRLIEAENVELNWNKRQRREADERIAQMQGGPLLVYSQEQMDDKNSQIAANKALYARSVAANAELTAMNRAMVYERDLRVGFIL